MIVNGGLVIIVCRIILLYEGTVTNILLNNLWSGLQYWIYGRACGARYWAPAH